MIRQGWPVRMFRIPITALPQGKLRADGRIVGQSTGSNDRRRATWQAGCNTLRQVEVIPVAIEREEILRLIDTLPPERLPMLDRIVRWLANEGGGRELIWDPDEVALIRDIVAHKDSERFFDADEADRYLRQWSGRGKTPPDR